VDQLVTRDATQAGSIRNPDRLRRYFEAYALDSAGVVADKTLFETADIDRKTAGSCEQLLKNLLVIESIPAWNTNRIKRLVKSPKRYLTDPALAGALLHTGPKIYALGERIQAVPMCCLWSGAGTRLTRQTATLCRARARRAAPAPRPDRRRRMGPPRAGPDHRLPDLAELRARGATRQPQADRGEVDLLGQAHRPPRDHEGGPRADRPHGRGRLLLGATAAFRAG